MEKSRSDIAKSSVVLAFIVLFVYGCLLLMIGYTQSGLANVIFGDNNHGGQMVYLLVAQSVGLILATLVMGKLLSKINVRWMFLAGFVVAAIMVLLISQFQNLHIPTQAGRIACFAVFSLIFGFAIGPMSPLVSTLLSAVYVGHKRTTMLSVSNGIYGIGAGILPLAFASVIIKAGSQTTFANVQPFYYAALGLAIFAAFCGFFINYKHSAQLTSSKILHEDKKDSKGSFNIWKPLIWAVALMSVYMITETIVNYMFTNVAQSSQTGVSASDAQTFATMGFGLFVMVQGLWRAGSGLFVTSKMKHWTFIFLSAVVMTAGLVGIVAGGLQFKWSIFVIAAILGIGVGNLWPVIYSYSIDIDDRRASFIGVVINITSMFWIPVTQVIVAAMWTSGKTQPVTSAHFLSVMIIALVASLLVISLLCASYKYYRHKGFIPQDKNNKFIQFIPKNKAAKTVHVAKSTRSSK